MRLVLSIAGGILLAGFVGWLFSIVILSAALSAAPTAITNANKQLTAQMMETQREAAAATARRVDEARAAEERAAQLQGEARAREASRFQMEREKSAAWSQYFTPAADCEKPKDWNAQVACGNAYIRAKRGFDTSWASSHPGSEPAGARAISY
jgi:parvulin-like peptidyl-prolyl isomerase